MLEQVNMEVVLKKAITQPEQLTRENMTNTSKHCLGCSELSDCQFSRRTAFEMANKELPFNLSKMTFDTFKANDKNSKALELSKQFSISSESMYIYGDPGLGKTHLLVSAYQETRNTQCPIYVEFYNMAKLLKIHRDDYETREESEDRLLERLARRKVIFLDDFSSENVTGKTAEIIYLLLNEAIENNRPRFFITGNKSLKFISENISDRISSRIAGLCGKNIIKLDGEDMRLK